MTHQFRHLEMRPYIVELRLCHLTGNANLTDWYVFTSFFNVRAYSLIRDFFIVVAVQRFLLLNFVVPKASHRHC